VRAFIEQVQVLAVRQLGEPLHQVGLKGLPVRPESFAIVRDPDQRGRQPAFQDVALTVNGFLQGGVHFGRSVYPQTIALTGVE